ncbi:MAG: glycosyltransferase family 4 protein [Steroidobacteraceae bacterium]
MPTATPPLRLLVDLRPALAGHAGIPHATRILFRSLSLLEDFRVEGLLQTLDRVLPPGLPANGSIWRRSLSADQQLNQLGRAVIAIEHRGWGSHAYATLQTLAMVFKHILGGKQTLTRFDATHFRDFFWRRFFARTLAPDDFEVVTRCGFRIARVPWAAMHICALVTRKLGHSLYPRLDTSDFEVMIAETPYPATVSRKTRLIVRYHDAVPMLMPDTISDSRLHQSFHYRALCKNVKSGAWFVCVSDATRSDLLSIFPELESRSVTIHNMVSHNYFSENSRRDYIPQIVKTRSNRKLTGDFGGNDPFDYLLSVSTIEPRKNHLCLLSAWEQLRRERFPNLKLILVGALGWHHTSIVRNFQPWISQGDAIFLEDVLASELRMLYRHAAATVCPSFGEGFDFSGVEAMKSGGVVVASDIVVHREIYADAAEYFNPYSVEELSRTLLQLLEPANVARRDKLISRGATLAQRYSLEALLPKWHSFISSVRKAPE